MIKTIITSLIFTILINLSYSQNRIYVSCAKEKALKVYDFDPSRKNKEIEEIQSLELNFRPASIVFSKDKKFAILSTGGNRKEKSQLVCFGVNKNGKLKKISSIEIDSKAAFLALSPDDKFIISAHYRSGEVMSHSINHAKDTINLKLIKKINTDKKAHCVKFHPSKNYFYVPHTGEFNKINQFIFDEKSGNFSFAEIKSTPAPENNGPRHLWFSNDSNFIYSSNEQGSSIGAWRCDSKNGSLEHLNSISSIEDKSFEGKNSCADIELSPNGKFAYVSNRGHNSIAIYKINQKSGGLEFVKNEMTLTIPRSFNISDDGNWFVVAGQRDNKLRLYKINQNSGILKVVNTFSTGNFPSWVEVITFSEN